MLTACVFLTINLCFNPDFFLKNGVDNNWPTRYPHITESGPVVNGPEGNGWEIPIEYIVREYQLGEGSFGKVAKGYIRGPVPGTHSMKDRIHAPVAMKFLKGIYLLDKSKFYFHSGF